MKALITTVPFGDKNRLPLEQLEAAGIEYLINPLNKKLTESELADMITDFDVIINLSVDDDRSLTHEAKIVSKNGMVYIHIPISWTKPQTDRMNLFFHILDGFMKEDKKVFIHCMKNYRVSVFMYLYKRDVLQEKKVKLIAPSDYKPTKVWRKLLKK